MPRDNIDKIDKISLIMIDGGFRERFDLIDSLNNQTLAKDKYELIWVEFYEDVDKRLKEKENLRIVTLKNKKSTVYHSAVCFNEGIKQSKGNLLVIIDADVIVPANLLEDVWNEHKDFDNLLLCYHRLVESKENHTGNFDIEHLKSVCYLDHPSNTGGCATIRKKTLLAVNGYEMHKSYQGGYHMCDQNLLVRLKNNGTLIKWHPSVRVYHPWHPGSGKCDRDRLSLSILKNTELTLKTLPYNGIDPTLNIQQKNYPEFLIDRSVSQKFLNNIILKLSIFQRFKGFKMLLTGKPD